MASRHLIEEMSVDIYFDSVAAARRQHDDLGAFVQARLLPLADEVFNELAAEGGVAKIARLEIDLGNIDYEHFQDEMAERFKEKLRSVLREKIDAIALAPSAVEYSFTGKDAPFRQLASFLETGRLAYQADLGALGDMNEWLLRLIRAEPARFADYLVATPHRHVVVERLVKQFKSDVLLEIVQQLISGRAGVHGFTEQNIGAALANVVKGCAGKQINPSLWERVINDLLYPHQSISEMSGVLGELQEASSPNKFSTRSIEDRLDEVGYLRGFADHHGQQGVMSDAPSVLAEHLDPSSEDIALYQRLIQRLCGATHEDATTMIMHVARAQPRLLGRLLRQLRSGELTLDAHRLSMGEAKQLLVALLDIEDAGKSAVLRRDIELNGAAATDERRFYLHLLDSLVGNGTIDLGATQSEAEKNRSDSLAHREPVSPLISPLISPLTELRADLATAFLQARPDIVVERWQAVCANAELVRDVFRQYLSDARRRNQVAESFTFAMLNDLVKLLAPAHGDEIVGALNKVSQLGSNSALIAAWTFALTYLYTLNGGGMFDKESYMQGLTRKLIESGVDSITCAHIFGDVVESDDSMSQLLSSGLWRARVEEALVLGQPAGIAAQWLQLCRDHAALLREIFMQRFAEAHTREQLASGFPLSMLLELVQALAPRDAQFIKALVLALASDFYRQQTSLDDDINLNSPSPELIPLSHAEEDLNLSEVISASSLKTHIWSYIFDFLYTSKLHHFERGDFSRGFVQSLYALGIANTFVLERISCIDPTLEKALSDFVPAQEAVHQQRRKAMDALANGDAQLFVSYLRQFQAGDIESETERMDELEMKQFVEAIVYLNLNSPQLAAGAKPMGFPKGRSGALPFGRRRGVHPDDDINLITGDAASPFQHQIDSYAARAHDRENYYRAILIGLLRDQSIDLEAAAGESQEAKSLKTATDKLLRSRLVIALTQGKPEEVTSIWREVCSRHAFLVREIFVHRFGDEQVRSTLVRGFPQSMLLDLAKLLVPAESHCIEMLASNLNALTSEADKNESFWEYTLAYLHRQRSGDFNRTDYLQGLLQLLAVQRGHGDVTVLIDHVLDAMLALPFSSAGGESPMATTVPFSGINSARSEGVLQPSDGLGVTDSNAVDGLSSAVGLLTADEARVCVASYLAPTTREVPASDFFIEVERHALQACDTRGYYHYVLENLLRGEIIDLELAVRSVARTTSLSNEALPAEVATALAQGDRSVLEALWRALCRDHETALHEALMRRLGSDETEEISQRNNAPEGSPLLMNGSAASNLYHQLGHRLRGLSSAQLSPQTIEALARDAPDLFEHLLRQLRAGELQVDVAELSVSEIRQFVLSFAVTQREAQESGLANAIENYEARANDQGKYYHHILRALIEGRNIDLEAALTYAAASSAGSAVRRQTQFLLRDADSDDEELYTEEIYIANAGLVLAAPYLPRLFGMLDLTADSKFKDRWAAERAVHLLQFMVNGSSDSPEFLLTLNKILCGVPSGVPIVRAIELQTRESETIESLLKAIIQNWKIIGATSVQGLRESFLQRAGRLRLSEEGWQLQVEKKGIDVLLDQLPWSFSLIKYAWMTRPIFVEWR